MFEQKQSVEIEDKAWAMELDRLAFGANMEFVFGIKDTKEHSRLWAIALRDESVDKQGTKDNPIIRVVQPKQIGMSKIRALSAKVTASSAIQNRADEVGAFRQLQNLANRAIADPAFAGHGQELLAEGTVFNPMNPGGAGQIILATDVLRAGQREPPPVPRSILPPSPPVMPDRALGRKWSDEGAANKPSSKKGAKRGKKAAIESSVAEKRAEALRMVKRMQS